MDRRSLLEHAIVILLAPLLASCALLFTPLSSLDTLARDAMTRAAAGWPPPLAPGLPDAVVVGIDSRSLSAFDDWPWPRSRYGALIRVLEQAGAAAIVFDVDFSTPREPGQDAVFGAAIAASGRIVLGAFQDFEELPGVGRIELINRPVSVLLNGATLGAGMVPFDADGAVRRARPVARIGGVALPSLALAALQVASGTTAGLDDWVKTTIDFRRGRPAVEVLSFADVLEGHVEPGRLAGRTVFVGATAPVLQDLWATPLGSRVPGVVIHAIEYRTHAARQAGLRTLSHAALGRQLLTALLISCLARLLGSGSHSRRIAGALALAAAIPLLSLAALVKLDVLFEPVSPLLVVGLHYLWSLERVRINIRKRLLAREQSIDALVHIGKIASDRLGPRQTEIALELLGTATSANWLILLPARAEGGFEPEAPSWARRGRAPAPRLDAAEQAFSAGEVRLSQTGGGEQQLYVPLATGAQRIGVLIAGYPKTGRPDETEVATIEAVAALIALAGTTDRLIHDLRAAGEAAQAASRAKTEFLANMSHEIRTPLNAVLGYTELLRDRALGPEERAVMAEAVRLNGEHVASLINDILDLSRIETGNLSLQKTWVNPLEHCQQILGMLGEQATQRGLSLELIRGAHVPELIETDPVRLRQVLVNLIGNALKFTPAGGFVRLHVGSDTADDARARLLRLRVEDCGIGMSDEVQARIFDAFFQADGSSTREQGGTGLGLAISRRLIGLLGGSISVQSAPGVGSVFRLTIATGDVATAKSAPAAPTQPAPTRLSGRVLVAEDGLDNQRIIRAFLTKAGLAVTLAEHGELAFELAMAAAAAGEDFDLIFMDIAMPVLDGHAATRKLREAGFAGPIVALTAHALATDREAALAAGCDDYMTKPVKREALVAMAARYLRSPKSTE